MQKPCKNIANTAVKKVKLSVNTAWAVLGNLAYVGGRIVIVVLLTRQFASVEVGRILYALAVVTPLSYLINMELRPVFVTDTHNHIKPGHCLASRLVSNTILMAVLLVLCTVQWTDWNWEKCIIILSAGAVRGSESWADVYLGVFQKCERMRLWAVSQISKTVLVLLWVVFMPFWTDNINWMLAGWLAATLLVILLYDRVYAGRLVGVKLRWELTIVKRLICLGFPLGVFVTLAILNQQVAQYFIEHELSYSAVAYYGVFMMYVSGMTTVQNGVNQAILPRLAQYFGKNKRQFLKLLGVVLGASVLVMLVGLIVVGWQGRAILRILNGEEYAEYAPLFFMMICAGCLLLVGMILGDAIIACHRFKSRMVAVGLGLAVNVIVCWRYVGDYGLKGAVWAAVLSAMVTTLVCGVVLISLFVRGKTLADIRQT